MLLMYIRYVKGFLSNGARASVLVVSLTKSRVVMKTINKADRTIRNIYLAIRKSNAIIKNINAPLETSRLHKHHEDGEHREDRAGPPPGLKSRLGHV